MQSSRQIVTTNKPTPNILTRPMPFLSPNHQYQSTVNCVLLVPSKSVYHCAIVATCYQPTLVRAAALKSFSAKPFGYLDRPDRLPRPVYTFAEGYTFQAGISLPARHSSDIPRRKPATNNRCRRPSSPAFSRHPVADRSAHTSINSQRLLVSRSSGKIVESPTRFHSERLVCHNLPPSSEESHVPFKLLYQLDLLSSVTLTLSSAFRLVLPVSVDYPPTL